MLEVQRLIADGAVGEVISARSWHCAPPLGDFYAGGAWRLSAGSAGGGVAIDTGSHWFRPLRMWLGEVTEVLAVTGHPFAGMEGESLCRSLGRFDSGVVASFDVTLTPGAAALEPFFQVTGTKGELVVEALGEVVLWDGSPGTELTGTVVGRGNYMHSYGNQIRAFEAAVARRRRVPRPAGVRPRRAEPSRGRHRSASPSTARRHSVESDGMWDRRRPVATRHPERSEQLADGLGGAVPGRRWPGGRGR